MSRYSERDYEIAEQVVDKIMANLGNQGFDVSIAGIGLEDIDILLLDTQAPLDRLDNDAVYRLEVITWLRENGWTVEPK